jgi:endonuclease IV
MDYEKMTVVQLKQLAKQRKLGGGLRLKKDFVNAHLAFDEAKDGDPRMGVEVNSGKHGLAASIGEWANRIPISCAQIFTHGPYSTRCNVRGPKMRLVSEAAAANCTRLWIHSSYLTFLNKDLPHFHDQLEAGVTMRAQGLVVHLPRSTAPEIADMVAQSAQEIKTAAKAGCRLILEMKALKQHPTMSFESPQKLAVLVRELEVRGFTPRDVGLCIDTAHINAGRAQITSYEEAVEWLREVPAEWVALFHINGNQYDARVRAGDKHALPHDGTDTIWRGVEWARSGCRAFIEWAQAHRVDWILEIKDPHTPEDVEAFMEWAGIEKNVPKVT